MAKICILNDDMYDALVALAGRSRNECLRAAASWLEGNAVVASDAVAFAETFTQRLESLVEEEQQVLDGGGAY